MEKTMIDISSIINDPDFSEVYKVKRLTFGINKGRLAVLSNDDIKIRCAVTPNINETRNMSDFHFEYIAGKTAFFTKSMLYGNALDKIKDESIIDFIFFNNNYWQVEEIKTWQHHGFIIAYAKMYETQHIIEELNYELYPAGNTGI